MVRVSHDPQNMGYEEALDTQSILVSQWSMSHIFILHLCTLTINQVKHTFRLSIDSILSTLTYEQNQ